MSIHQEPEGEQRTTLSRFRLFMDNYGTMLRVAVLIIGLGIYFLILPASTRSTFWGALISNRILTLMLIGFSLTVISLIWATGQKLDTWAFLHFNLHGIRPLWLDRVMLGLTQLGSGLTSIILAVIFYWRNNLLAYELVLGTLTLWLVVELLKFLVSRARPFIGLVETRLVGYRARGRSFPSGHTSQVFFVATLLTQHFQFNFWIAILVYILALLVGITRMYIGVHYPRDVLAGAILGSAWGLLGAILEGYLLGPR